MKISAILFILGLIAINVNSKEVFRYEDKETKQSHYMEGNPGNSVNGGWEFVAPEGVNYELEYVANNKGFQPQANHIPNPVKETKEVAKAKAEFMSRFKAMENNEAVTGEWEFTSPEGMPYKVSYTADQFGGFLPKADHIPVQVDDTEEVQQAKIQFYKMFDETSAKLKALENKRVERQAEDKQSYYHPYYYHPHYYHYPQHLIPDMKLSEEETEKIQMDMKEVDEKYMKDNMETLKEDFPMYPNFYPTLTHFPVKEEEVGDNKVEKPEETMPLKSQPLHPYTIPDYYTYFHGKMEEDSNMEEQQPNNKHGYIFPHPRNVMYYPVISSSPVYRPSNVQVTKTTVMLDDSMMDMAEESGENVDVVSSEEMVVGAEGAEFSPDMEVEPQPEVEVELESPAEPEVEPENHPESPAVVPGTDIKGTQPHPIYYPHQAVLGSNVASLRPAFHPFWSTRFNYLPVYPSMLYPSYQYKSLNTDTKASDVVGVNALPSEIFSTFPVEGKDLKPAAIVA